MTRIELTVNGAEVKAKVHGPLTGGMVGIGVSIRYDHTWDGMVKTLVCKSSVENNCADEVRTVLDVAANATVAHEVMIAGRTLYLGIEGRSADGCKVIPTIWADCGKIQPGAQAEGDPTVAKTPETWEQLLVKMGSLDDLDTERKENLVAAINEALTKGNGEPGRGIVSVSGNEDGSWTFLYDDGMEERVSNEAYIAMAEKMERIFADIQGKAQLTPEFADSIEECTDTSKLYVLPDGYIYAYMAHEEYPFTNQIPLSIDTDKTVYNGFGYKSGYRINREGLEVEQSGDAVTGFIPIKVGDVLHFKNIDYKPGNTVSAGYLAFYNGNFENIQAARDTDGLDAIGFVVDAYTTDETTGQLTSLTVRDKYNNGVSYFRISSPQLDNTSIITLNEEITGEPVLTYRWTNTGHAFVPADYEDRIIKAENDITTLKQAIAGDIAVYGIVDEENNIVMTGTLTPGKYSLKYMNEDGTTTDIGEFTMW